MTMQCAGVKKVLGSVSKMVEANNTIIFSKDKSVIMPDPGSRLARRAIGGADQSTITELQKNRGVYKFCLLAPKHTCVAGCTHSHEKSAEETSGGGGERKPTDRLK